MTHLLDNPNVQDMNRKETLKIFVKSYMIIRLFVVVFMYK
jgi:hypothetical protein